MNRQTAQIVISAYLMMIGVLSFHHHAHNIDLFSDYAINNLSAENHEGDHNQHVCQIFNYSGTQNIFVDDLNAVPHFFEEQINIPSTLIFSKFTSYFNSNVKRGPPKAV